MIVFDLTNQKTFENLKKWIEEVKKNADSNIVLMLVGKKSSNYCNKKKFNFRLIKGNKLDLKESRAVKIFDAREFAGNLKNLIIIFNDYNTIENFIKPKIICHTLKLRLLIQQTLKRHLSAF